MRGGRSTERELMDDPGVPYLHLERALDELGTINRWLGGHRTTRIGVERLIRNLSNQTPIRVLDLASGGTDLPAVLAPLRRRFDVTALDVNPLMVEYARRRGFKANQVTGSAFALPFPDEAFDIVHISLFLHHCTELQAIALLARARRTARIGIVINDLHRHSLAHAAITLLTGLLSRSQIVRNDASASVRSAFTRSELRSLLLRAGIPGANLTWQWAFRWCLTVPRESAHGNE